MMMLTMNRGPNSKENLEAVTDFVAVVAIQFCMPIIDGELRTESDIKPIAMGEIVHVTE